MAAKNNNNNKMCKQMKKIWVQINKKNARKKQTSEISQKTPSRQQNRK